MEAFNSTKKEWTFLVGITAQGNYMIKGLPGEFFHRLGAQGRSVDTQLSQNLSSQRVDPCSFSSGGKGLAVVAHKVIGQRFGHLGTARIVGAEEKDLFFHATSISAFTDISSYN
jgi:hypothetical protein